MINKNFLLLFLISIATYSSLPIIPDVNNPIQFQIPTKNEPGQKLIINFKLHPESKGLSYGQVIGVKLSTKLTENFICKLTNQETKADISVSAKTDTNFIYTYCKIDQYEGLKTNTYYKLEITFNFMFTTNFINQVGIHTATDSDINSVKIDSTQNLGNIGLYNDLYTTTPLDIINSSFINNTGDFSGKLFVNNNIDILLTFKAQVEMNMNDFDLLIVYSKELTLPTSVTSEKFDSNGPLTDALSSTLTLSNYETNSQFINGINETFKEGRTFKLKLSGFITKELGSASLEIKLLYKYSKTTVSYKNLQFNVEQFTLNMSSDHPNGWNIWRNGAWPVKFQITSPYDIENVWIKIQHTNALYGKNRFSFIASTCDFSDNSTNEFGKRNNCYSLKNFPFFPDDTLKEFPGSGIFFKIDKLNKSTPFIFQVWGYADNCGGDFSENMDLIKNKDKSQVYFAFTAYLYNDISPNLYDEQRLSKLIATSNKSVMLSSCINNISYNFSPNRFDDYILNSITLDNSNSLNTKDINLYKEHYDFGIVKYQGTCDSCWLKDMSKDFDEGFLYGKNNNSVGESYIGMRSLLKKYAKDKLYQFFAVPYTNAGNINGLTNHKLEFRVGKEWMTKSDTIDGQLNCYLSWGFKYNNLSKQSILLKDSFETLVYDGDMNTIVSKTNVNNQSPTIDINDSLKDDISYYKITSVKNDVSNKKFGISNLFDAPNNDDIANFGLFTNCLKWKSVLPTIKSLYAYIDIQWLYTYIGGSGDSNIATNRNNRFVKFYPEGGLFQDYKTIQSDKFSLNNPITFHLTWNHVQSNNLGLCLLEINGSDINNLYTEGSDTLSIWLYHGTLLETDYLDPSANYPVTPIASNINVYGLQTGIPQTTENYFYVGSYNNMFEADFSEINGKGKTNYQIFLGSLLLFTGVKNGNIGDSGLGENMKNLLIPFYCPILDSQIYSSTNLPLVLSSWINMSSYNSVESINSYIGYKSASKNYVALTSNINKPHAVGEFYDAILKFNIYSNLNDKQKLYVYNGSSKIQGENVNCSAHLLFLNKIVDVTIGDLGLNGISDIINRQILKNSKFYIFGSEFTKGVISTSSPKTMIKNDYTDSTTSIYYSGVLRPEISKLNDYMIDTISYTCISSNFGDYGGLSNFIFDTDKNIIANVIDLNFDHSTLSNVILTVDKIEDIFKNEVADNFKIIFSLPSGIPVGSRIQIALDKSLSESKCGLIENGITSECSIENDSTVCQNKIEGNNYQVCCYGIDIDSNTYIKSLDIYIPLKNSWFSNGKMYGILNNSEVIPTMYKLNNEWTKATITENQLASINLTYSSINQVDSIGYMILKITLPKQIKRNMTVKIFGDFTNLLIPNVVPICSVTSDGALNPIIESCDITKITDNTLPLIITTKNNIYKCGEVFSKNIEVKISTIILKDFKSDILKNNKYKVTYQYGSKANLNIFETNFTNSDLKASPIKSNLWNTLCPVSNIIPSIPGEYSEYSFTFDIEGNKAILTENKANEFQINFNLNYFDISNESIKCFYANSRANCNVDSDGIFTLKLQETVIVGSGQALIIKIVGIKSSSIDENFVLPCSINKTNYITGERTQILVGSGKLPFAVQIKADTKQGILEMIKLEKYVSDSNPRDISTHLFQVSIDKRTNLTPKPITFDKSPFFSILFPDEYDFSLYDNKFNAVITSFVYNDNNELVQNTLENSGVTVNGNRVNISIKDSFTLNVGWSYFEISVSGVPNPINITNLNTVQKSNLPLSIFISNSDNSIIFRTFSNLLFDYNYNPSLLYSRGNIFSYDNSKYVIDINGDFNNMMNVKPGRFSQFNIRIRSNNLRKDLITTDISLDDNRFVLQNEKYTIATAFNENIPFLFGIPCESVPGYYIVKFKIAGSLDAFAPLPIMTVLVSGYSDKASISYISPSSVPQGSSLWVFYNISEPNVDPLNIKWTKDLKNDSTVSLTDAIIPRATVPKQSNSLDIYSTFTISNLNKIDILQKFTTVSPNSCYTWQNPSISIEISGQPAYIPPSYDFSNFISYFDNKMDSNISPNSISFKFNSKISPAYLYCTLACENYAKFTTEEIITKRNSTNEFIQQQRKYIDNTETKTILFDNLDRSKSYFLTCVLESTQSEKSNRTASKIYINKYSYNYNNQTVTNLFSPPDNYPTTCTEFIFNGTPSNDTINNIVNNCQYAISQNGYYTNGCSVCTDQKGTLTVPGVQIFKEDCIQTPISRLRYLEDLSGSNLLISSSNLTTSLTNITTTLSNITAALTNNTITANNITDVILSPSTQQINSTNYYIRSCVYSNPNCPTNRKGNYSEFKSLYSSIGNQFSQVYNSAKNNFSIIKINYYDDELPPNLSLMNITDLKYRMDGYVEWNSLYPHPLQCRWIFKSNLNSIPTFDEIYECTSAYCGEGKSNYLGVNTSTDVKNLYPLSNDLEYNLYYACYNDLTKPVQRSEVRLVSKFSTPKTPIPPVNNNTDNSNTNLIDSSFVQFYYPLLLIIFIILN